MNSGAKILLIVGALIWGMVSWHWYTCDIKGFCGIKKTQIEAPKPIKANPPKKKTIEKPPPTEPEPEPFNEVIMPDLSEHCEDGVYLYATIRRHQVNNYKQSLRLEEFINTYLDGNVIVDGYYGDNDKAIIRRFQMEHYDEILAPWGLGHATGFIYETTRNKINEIVCGS